MSTQMTDEMKAREAAARAAAEASPGRGWRDITDPAIDAYLAALSPLPDEQLDEEDLAREMVSAIARLRALSPHPDEGTVTTVEELDAMPEGTVVLDAEGDVWQYRGGLWCTYETAPCGSERTFRKYGPLRVLFRPTYEGSGS